MRMRVLATNLRVEIENETRVFLESLDFEIEMRVSQKSVLELVSLSQKVTKRFSPKSNLGDVSILIPYSIQ